jgi:hypothetical protein
MVAGAHHRRQYVNELPQFGGENVPTIPNVAVQREGFILRQYKYPAQAGIDTVRQCDIDDTVDAAEGYGRLGSVSRKRVQSLAGTSGQEADQNIMNGINLRHRDLVRANSLSDAKSFLIVNIEGLGNYMPGSPLHHPKRMSLYKDI